MLEVDVDVRRLIAFAGDEAFEQQVYVFAGRVQLGDAKGEADHRVGRRAASLAENALAAGKGDDVVDREEVAVVLKLGDQRKFILDTLADGGIGAVFPAAQDAFLGLLPQPGGGRVTFGHQLARVLIIQLTEIEGATLGNLQSLRQQIVRIDRRQRLPRPQMPLAVRIEILAGLVHRQVLADGGHAVLQGAAAADMHVHVAAGHGGDGQARGLFAQAMQLAGVVRALVQLDAQPQALGEAFAQPQAVLILVVSRQPDRQQVVEVAVEVRAYQAVAAFLGAAPGVGEQAAEVFVASEVLRQQHQFRALLDVQFAAGDQGNLGFLRGLPGADDAGQAAFVGDRQGAVAQLLRPLEQLGRAGGAALEAEVGQAVQLGIVDAFDRRAHANQPCSSNGPSSPTGRNTQARCPLRVRTW